jgi:DNA sulfur modification protein DndD
MKISRIYAENYKTYRHLDLNLEVEEDRPIILIGGGNGCGKTTLFDAIYHALYGLSIKTTKQFDELFNAGVRLVSNFTGGDIILQVDFSGMVLGREQQYTLKRTYRVIGDHVAESVQLKMGGNTYTYGSAQTASQRAQNEEIVRKIITANLPSELSTYFLFDAMKTSDLLKEEKINAVIEKNINSVMGFNKYIQLRHSAATLLESKKAERLENENQRKEYESLVKERKRKEEDLEGYKEEYAQKLAYANDHKEQYELVKKGRNADDVTRDKIQKIQESLDLYSRQEKEYRKEADTICKDIETNVIYPKLADVIRTEVEVVLNEKSRALQARDKQFTEEQISELTTKIVRLIEEQEGKPEGSHDISSIVRQIVEGQQNGNVEDAYSFLTDAEVRLLGTLVNSPYVNPFVGLDEKRERLNNERIELPKRRQQLEDYQREIGGHDYTIIELYEENDRRIQELKNTMESLDADIKQLSEKISRYDYDIPQVPDPKYDMLCKLPDFFKNLSAKLLRAKKTSIERMMCEELNQNLVVYAGVIGRVELSSENSEDISFKFFHKNGNEISINQLNAGAKQTVMQVLLKVLYKLGDYEPPVMIDTVMGVLDKASREVILEHYFPDLAHQTILLSTDTEITTERDFEKIQAYVSKTYTLHRDKENQCTNITNDYFGTKVNEL